MPSDGAPDAFSIVAILRGILPENVVGIAHGLVAAGIRAIEVPLNSPDPFASIARLRDAAGTSCLCGAGTVLKADDIDRVHDAGGRLIVSPNVDPRVIAHRCSRTGNGRDARLRDGDRGVRPRSTCRR